VVPIAGRLTGADADVGADVLGFGTAVAGEIAEDAAGNAEGNGIRRIQLGGLPFPASDSGAEPAAM
jgi:hypothetical protein